MVAYRREAKPELNHSASLYLGICKGTGSLPVRLYWLRLIGVRLCSQSVIFTIISVALLSQLVI